MTADPSVDASSVSQNQSILRFITCGSVDDGKSTLIGRLLYDGKLLPDDQLAALERDSRQVGTVESGLDFALLMDGLAAERAQGITIDVAYRYFSTARRKFIVADAPGHEQYTRNMITAASTAELAVLLVDARKGLLLQTHRHSHIAFMLGIRHIVLAVNKMDLVDFDHAVFERIVAAYRAFAHDLGLPMITAIPVSALRGDNIALPSPAMPWYNGPALIPFLETVDVATLEEGRTFCLPVQWVNRPHLDFRGYAGTVAGAPVRTGDAVQALPSGRSSRIARIVTMAGDLAEAIPGQAVTLTLTDEIDISRGDVITHADQSDIVVADQFAAHIVWFGRQPLPPGRVYLVRFHTAQVNGQITELKHRINVDSLKHQAAKHLEMNEVGFCNLKLDQAVPFQPYVKSRAMGAFILIDRLTNETAGAGMVAFPLRRAFALPLQPLSLDKSARSALKHQQALLIWFTGLPGSGKSTIANLVEQRLFALGHHTYLLDGNNVRHGLCQDLGFTDEDRIENVRRVTEVARLMVDAGLITLVSMISPFCAERQRAKELMVAGEFLEIFVDAPLAECELRDPNGLYHKARRHTAKNVTGIDSVYEPPPFADLRLDTTLSCADDCADQVLALLIRRKLIR